MKKASVEGGLKCAFERECIRVAVADLVPLKVQRPTFKSSRKYQQILASVRTVGLIEPPAILPVKRNSDQYCIVDGHLRIEALKDLEVEQVNCMLARNDDTYSYNKRINRLSAVQEHKMIVRAVERGVAPERLADALGLSVDAVLQRFKLLNGICKEASSLLADAQCPAKVFDIFRQMKPLRQIEAAQLMIGHKNYSIQFANAILIATNHNQLVSVRKATAGAVSADSIARLERELAALQTQSKEVEESCGTSVMHFTLTARYLSALLACPRVRRWITKHQPEYLREFKAITAMLQETGGKRPRSAKIARAEARA